MDDDTRRALEEVVTYLWDDEEQDYHENPECRPHIFEQLQILREELDRDEDARGQIGWEGDE